LGIRDAKNEERDRLKEMLRVGEVEGERRREREREGEADI